MGTIKESLTFDDVLLLPRYSNVLPTDTNISLNLTDKIILQGALFVFCYGYSYRIKMAIAIARIWRIGIIHRNLNIKDQAKEVIKVKNKNLLVGAAVGTSKEDLLRSKVFN